MDQENQGIRILKAEIKNFKSIDYKQIDIDGRSLIIAGPNQAGKSTMIQALMSPVDSKYIPIEPIKEGEEKGSVSIVIGGSLDGEPVKYDIGVHFTPGNKRGKLTMTDLNGGAKLKDGIKGAIDQLVGNISFDIMEFIRMGVTSTGKVSKEGVKKQIEILKGLMPLEVVKQLGELDRERLTIYEKRTDLNREIKFFGNQVIEAGYSQEDIDKYSKRLDTVEIIQKIDEAKETNERLVKSHEFVNDTANFINDAEEEIKELQTQIELKRKEIKERQELDVKYQKYIERNAQKDITWLQEQLANVSEHNTHHEKVKQVEENNKQAREKRDEAEAITQRIKAIDKEKKEIFSSAKMPVKGLAFDEDTVTFRGLPLSDGNISTSQLIGIGLRVGMALNPNLRLLVVRDGSLLDDQTMQYILGMCEKHGYQLLIEVVKSDEGELTIEYVES
jgi:hypothetical protein